MLAPRPALIEIESALDKQHDKSKAISRSFMCFWSFLSLLSTTLDLFLSASDP